MKPWVVVPVFLALAVLVGANVAVDLRFLGVGRQIPLAEMKRFFTAMWLGFTVNAITGALLFTVDPTTKGVAHIFMIKLAFIATGVMLIVLLRRAVYGGGREGALVPSRAKAFAALSLLVCTAAIAAGRLQAYITL